MPRGATSHIAPERRGHALLALVAALVAAIVCTALLFAPARAYADEGDGTLDVLFVGSSFTYQSGNGVAETLSKLAKVNGKSLYAKHLAYGGLALQRYASDTVYGDKHRIAFDNALASRDWDIVVLQDRPKFVIAYPSAAYQSTRVLVERIALAHPNAEVLIYMTHGFADGTSTVVNGRSRVLSASNMQIYAQGYYALVGARLGLRTVPVGICHEKWNASGVGVNLLGDDSKHQNAIGFLLAACCFYHAIFGEAPEQLPASADVLTQEAQELMRSLSATEVNVLSPQGIAMGVGARGKVSRIVTPDPPTPSDPPAPFGEGDNGEGQDQAGDDAPDPAGGNSGSGDSSGVDSGDGSDGDPGDIPGDVSGDGSGDDSGDEPVEPVDPAEPDEPDEPVEPVVTWGFRSLDSSVVSADDYGIVVGNREGRTVVYAKSSAGDIEPCYVSVESLDLLAKKIRFNKSSYAVTVGNYVTTSIEVSESLGAYSLKWSSSNPSVAKVDEMGVVTTLKAGRANIVVKDEMSGYSASCRVTVRPPAPTNVKAKRAAGTLDGKRVLAVKLTWKAVTGAKSYKVYRLSGSGYSLIGTATRASYLDKKAPLNRKLSYKVVAVDKKSSVASVKSDKASAVRLGMPTLKARVVKSSVSLSWKKNSLADGYVLQRAVGKAGKFVTLKRFSTGSKVRFRDGTATKGRLYRYRVRSFRVIDGRTFYSAYSQEAEVRIEKAAKKQKLVSATAKK